MPGSGQPGSGHENQSELEDLRAQEARNAKTSDEGPKAARGPNAGSRPDFERGEERTFETPPDGQADDRYDPSPVEASRAREQGLGVGERDLQRQRDAHRPVPPAGEDDRPDGE